MRILTNIIIILAAIANTMLVTYVLTHKDKGGDINA